MPKVTNNRSKKNRKAQSKANKKLSWDLTRGASGTSMARSIGQAIGAALGSKVGQPHIGAKLGGTAAAKLSRLIGHGDYEMSDPVVANSLVKGHVPASANFSRDNMGRIRLRKREFIKNVRCSGDDFSIDSIICQPGLTEPFPYLSNIARNFTKYEPHGIVYEFVSLVSPYSSVAQMGSIVMAFNTNQGDASYTNKAAMENTGGAISFRPDKNCVFGVECAEKLRPYKQYFVRSGSTDQTNTSEDFGRMYIAQSGLPSTYAKGDVLGELWVTYDIEFDVPRMPTDEAGYFNVAGSINAVLVPTSTSANSQASGLCYSMWTEVTSGGDSLIRFWNVPTGSILVVTASFTDTSLTSSWKCSIDNPNTADNGLEEVSMFRDAQGAKSEIVSGINSSKLCIAMAVMVTAAIPTGTYNYPTLKITSNGTTQGTNPFANIVVYTLGQGKTFSSTAP